MTDIPPQDLEAERGVLGALMVAPKMLRPILLSGLKREHFYRDSHRAIFAACQELAVKKQDVDALTVWDQLRRMGGERSGESSYPGDEKVPSGITKSMVSEMASTVPVPSNAPRYARIVVEMANLRAKLAGASEIIAGVHERNASRIQSGLEQAAHDIATETEPTEPHEIGEVLRAYLAQKTVPEAFVLPWPSLTDHLGAGGLERGELTIIAAWTSIGKSMVLDQMLHAFADQGKRCLLLSTEMSLRERGFRFVTSQTGVPYSKLVRRLPLDDEERADVEEATHRIPWGFRDAAGWTATQICQEIVAREADVAAVDPLNIMPEASRTDTYDEALRQLKATAIRANCTIIGVSELNMARFREESPPAPALRDLRDSGKVQFIASNILSIHRTFKGGDPTKQGELRWLKVRNGVKGRCAVEFLPGAFRFIEPPPKAEPAPEPETQFLDYTGAGLIDNPD